MWKKLVLSKVCEKRKNVTMYVYANLNNKIQRSNEGVSHDKESLETHKDIVSKTKGP